MPNISGSVVFDVNRTGTIDASDTGLANVPVVLRNTTSGLRLTVITDSNGNYVFTNVPNGTYTLVEAYGTLGGVVSPGNFLTATAGPVVTGEDPLISFATNPPATSTNLDSLTPNTLNITVAGSDLTNENFLDGPVLYTPITSILDPCATLSSTNLITAASSGSFGSFTAGTPVETGANPNPYPGISSGFSYILPSVPSTRPLDGTYTIQNIATNMTVNTTNTWWRIADHTTGDEGGRFQGIGGASPGASFFQDVVTVTPNTNYLFSGWIMNLIRNPALAEPLLGVEVLDQNGSVIYSQTLGNLIPANTIQPEWKEIGTGLNSGNNTSLTVRFISQGPAAAGNDFAIDDIAFRAITIPSIVPQKSSDKAYAEVGDTVTYTVILSNPCQSTLTNVSFIDNIPNGLTFVSGSVTVNGVPSAALDPEAGFTVPDITGGATAIIQYRAQVTSLPSPNTVQNIASMSYDYSPVVGGVPVTYTFNTNPVSLTVNSANVSISKSADKQYAKSGEIINYTITVTNSGNVEANPAVVTDIIPNGTTYVSNSLVIDGVSSSLNPSTGIDLSSILPGETNIINFSVRVNDDVELMTIENTASIDYQYVVDPTQPKKEVTKNSNTITLQLVKIEALKVGNIGKINVGDTMTYTITITNKGTVPVDNVIFTDPLPDGVSYVTDSFTLSGVVVPGANPEAGVNIGTIAANTTVVVEFQVKLDSRPCTNSLVNTANLSFNFNVPQSTSALTETATSNSIVTEIITTSFKQIDVDSTLNIPTAKPDIEAVIDITATITINSWNVITSPKGLSNEGQNLSGKKLIICGNIHEILEYVALVSDQSVNSAHFDIPFCTFIVMDESLQDTCNIDVTTYIEDIYVAQLDTRNAFSNITFRLETGQ